LLTPHEAFFHRCTKCCVFKVWLQLHVILCHHEGCLLWLTLERVGIVDCCCVWEWCSIKHEKMARRQVGASWLSVSTCAASGY